MVKGINLPSDDELRGMSDPELKALADTLDDKGQEALSSALIRIHDGWRDGAHSETSDTRRRRRIVGREIPIGEHADHIPVTISEYVIRRLMGQAARAALTEEQRLVWVLHDYEGLSQRIIADLLGIKQPAVSRCLNRARIALWNHIDKHSPAYRAFLEDSHQAKYIAPSYRPPLPVGLDAARQEFERDQATYTHIQIYKPRRVEIWRNGEPVMERDKCGDAVLGEDGQELVMSLTYRGIMRDARRIRARREKKKS
jgi:hypothetical protein